MEIFFSYSKTKALTLTVFVEDLSDWNAYPEDIAFWERNVKYVWLYSFLSSWFLSRWIFPRQGFNEVTNSTPMTDTQGKY